MKVLTDEEIKLNIAANSQRLLVIKRWSQKDLAEMAGVPPMTVSVLVRGEHMPGVGILSRVAEALDVTIDRLIAAPPSQKKQKSNA
jgi:transcriptional regulator with XRE-family HTH domain